MGCAVDTGSGMQRDRRLAWTCPQVSIRSPIVPSPQPNMNTTLCSYGAVMSSGYLMRPAAGVRDSWVQLLLYVGPGASFASGTTSAVNAEQQEVRGPQAIGCTATGRGQWLQEREARLNSDKHSGSHDAMAGAGHDRIADAALSPPRDARHGWPSIESKTKAGRGLGRAKRGKEGADRGLNPGPLAP